MTYTSLYLLASVSTALGTGILAGATSSTLQGYRVLTQPKRGFITALMLAAVYYNFVTQVFGK